MNSSVRKCVVCVCWREIVCVCVCVHSFCACSLNSQKHTLRTITLGCLLSSISQPTYLRTYTHATPIPPPPPSPPNNTHESRIAKHIGWNTVSRASPITRRWRDTHAHSRTRCVHCRCNSAKRTSGGNAHRKRIRFPLLPQPPPTENVLQSRSDHLLLLKETRTLGKYINSHITPGGGLAQSGRLI
jgi:hypothetical protein